MTTIRSRWAAIGAAVAVTLGAGGISLGQAAISSGDKPVFVGIEPCRLVDTRPGDDNIGDRSTPLGADDTLSLQITGSTGECTGIPTGALAAAMNVTAIQGSTRSFLSVYPADAALPLASNLNWNGGDPPTPNKVDVKLSPTGAVSITNAFGTVHVAADLVGYYVDHTHDDRYYTKGQGNSRYAGRTRTDTISWLEMFFPSGSFAGEMNGCAATSDIGQLPFTLPVDASIQSVEVSVFDSSGSAPYTVRLIKRTADANGLDLQILTTANGGGSFLRVDHDLTPPTPEVVDTGETFEIRFSPGQPVGNSFCSAQVTYALPPAS